MVSTQIFIYNLPKIDVTNRFPNLIFDNPEKLCEFIKNLNLYWTEPQDNQPYFVINNPHYLPKEVRYSCKCKYSLIDNIDIFLNTTIDDNTHNEYTFSDAINDINEKLNSYVLK
jgi:hypothetical protein